MNFGLRDIGATQITNYNTANGTLKTKVRKIADNSLAKNWLS